MKLFRAIQWAIALSLAITGFAAYPEESVNGVFFTLSMLCAIACGEDFLTIKEEA